MTSGSLVPGLRGTGKTIWRGKGAAMENLVFGLSLSQTLWAVVATAIVLPVVWSTLKWAWRRIRRKKADSGAYMALLKYPG